MMRKYIIAAGILLLVVILGGYYIYDNIFPVAEPIQCPQIEDITSINVSTDGNRKSKILGADFAAIVTYICNSKPTRDKSINDCPTVRPYYKIEIVMGEKTIIYFVYEDNNKVYIERPYEGVYTTDSKVVNIVSKWILWAQEL